MNVTELARRINVNTAELLEILPEFGFDIGKRAIKVDDKVSGQIIKIGPRIKDRISTIKINKQRELAKLAKESPAFAEASAGEPINLPAYITVRDFAQKINKPVNEVIKQLMKNGVLATLNQKIDFETAAIIGDEYGLKLNLLEGEKTEDNAEEKIKEIMSRETDLVGRPPVIVVMGHVDHGKTKLLDAIRKTDVMGGEAGGITQHIGAYQVKRKGKLITFIDTPGHEAFTAMRSRGAKIADVAILVVAANDSVKPQTQEAIKIIQQAKIPLIVAINKIDLPEANIEKVKQDLASLNLAPEDWGGSTVCVPISAKQGTGIDELLEAVLLVSEMNEEKIMANPQSQAVGTVIESHLDKGEGPVATLIVQNGTLQIGDNLCVNNVFFGKARALKDYNSQNVNNAGPSMPIKIIGLKYSPQVGDIMEATCEIKREHKKAPAALVMRGAVLSVPGKEGKEENAKKLNLIIKTDVLGSLEVISETLEKIESKEVGIKIISQGLGNINDADVDLALSGKASIIGFHVKATPSAQDLAREKNVEIKIYDVIYNLFDDVKAKLLELMEPQVAKKIIGKVEVLAIFKTESKSMVLGGKVLEGKINAGLKADVLHGGKLSVSGEIKEVQVGKEKVSEVAEGQSCGISFLGWPEIKVGDIMEVYKEELTKARL